MPVVWIENNEKRMSVEVPAGQTILHILQENVPEYAFPCGGNHTCGKCLVEAAGTLSEISEEERQLLPEGSGLRLACFARIDGDCRVKLLEKERKQEISKTFEADLFFKISSVSWALSSDLLLRSSISG